MSKVLYVAGEWKDVSDNYHVQCEDLVGTGRNWIEPARILNLSPVDFISLLRNEYGADITPYRKDGKLTFIGYSWKELAQARKFKNYINRIAREKNYTV